MDKQVNKAAVLLDLQHVTVKYGKTTAVHDVNLHITSGEIIAIIGANGAGKSSILKAVLGVGGKMTGDMLFDGTSLTGLPTDKRVENGLALVPEGRHVFPRLSVIGNLELGFNRGKKSELFGRMEKMFTLFPILKTRQDQMAGTLSGGEQQMLVIGRALMSAPRLLMLDEPTLGLAPKMVTVVATLLSVLRSEGQTILIAEQNARMSLSVSDRAYVLAQGNVITEGVSSELLESDEIRKAYLGR